jgi:hypothetical protein
MRLREADEEKRATIHVSRLSLIISDSWVGDVVY